MFSSDAGQNVPLIVYGDLDLGLQELLLAFYPQFSFCQAHTVNSQRERKVTCNSAVLNLFSPIKNLNAFNYIYMYNVHMLRKIA